MAWIALVAVGIVGRLWQPAYGVTPIVGLAVAAGAFFPSRLVAASVPAAALAASNLALPGGGAYGSWTMAGLVYGAMVWPVALGEFVRRRKILGAVGGALAGSLVFFVATNAGHWLLTHDYPHTPAGLVECFVAALPFYRWMPVGDLAWTVALWTALSAVPALVRQGRSEVA